MPHFTNEPVESDVATSGAAPVVGRNTWAPADPPGAGGNGGWFESAQGEGVRGWAKTPHHGGVVGVNTAGGIAVYGTSDDGPGVFGESKSNEGVRGTSHNPNHAGIVGVNDGGGDAGFFAGNVGVTGALTVTQDIVLANADCAEEFDIIAGSESVEPGTVVVLDDSGGVRMSDLSYDPRVAGVVSGGGDYRPAVIMDRRATSSLRLPVALMGKVYCRLDATESPIAIGDLLTTSSTPGYAMRASDRVQAFGAVIGKALRPLTSGRGLVPILVALQ